jgi:hypothetical protein
MSILDVFCSVDDFWQGFAPQWHTQLLAAGKHRMRAGRMYPSEIMTILILFHQSHYRTCNAFYLDDVCVQLRGEFPHLLSYPHFVAVMPSLLGPLCAYLFSFCGTCTGMSFVDSTPLAVCKNPRIPRHRVFADLAQRGKTSVGWFSGFKLHLVVNDQGDLLAFWLTPGNVDDRAPLPTLLRQIRRLWGKVVGDRGSVSQAVADQVAETFSCTLLARPRKTMRRQLDDPFDRWLVRQRAIIETIIDQLKNISQIEHSRHRSPLNFLVNLFAGLIAYCHQPKKPSLDPEGRWLLVW